MSQQATRAQATQARALEQLLAQGGGAFSGSKIPTIDGPTPALYGIYGQAAAQAANTAAEDPYFGAGRRSTLNMQADNEANRYEAQLAAQQEAALKAQKFAQGAEIRSIAANKARWNDAPIGTFTEGQDQYGYSVIKTDPGYAGAFNSQEAEQRQATTLATEAGAIETLGKAGYGFSKPALTGILRGSLENPDTAPQVIDHMNPEAVTGRINARTFEEDMALQAARDEAAMARTQAAADGDDGKWKLVYNEDGTVSRTYTGVGPPENINANGSQSTVDAILGRLIPSPNADAQAPGASATQGGFKGIAGERVTSTKRSKAKNTAVGGTANSYHLTGEARDSVPPKGMAMGAYWNRLRDLNPDKHVINEGDHVHMEPKKRSSSKPVQQASAAPPKIGNTSVDKLTGMLAVAQRRGLTIKQIPGGFTATDPATGRSKSYNMNGDPIG